MRLTLVCCLLALPVRVLCPLSIPCRLFVEDPILLLIFKTRLKEICVTLSSAQECSLAFCAMMAL